ncbi:zinc finger protein 613 [Phlebotomus papatasi]|uniref:zinc finger protein 613 n=1 Tax=Phlebotomus papatasi TaxID=29031 RepID=UPI0024846EE5|nr:zinc finger protein 613 [Phlebotomus papatasi]
MNFSAFGGPFSGIHQFAAKFGNDSTQLGSYAANASSESGAQDTRYANPNHFSQNPAVSSPNMQYAQNISIPYASGQPSQNEHLFLHDKQKSVGLKLDRSRDDAVLNQQILQNVNQSWQTLANPANSVDYSSHLLSATLPISIQHFLKYSESIKKESGISGTGPSGAANGAVTSAASSLLAANLSHELEADLNPPTSVASGPPAAASGTTGTGKKKKKKAPKQKAPRTVKKPRPKPGEIRETKALDGSTLYCCPECQMAYPDRPLIEQHVISHAIERRFVCDICNAALKRKDHLTRHKLSHIPDRPHICNICMKSFKRKEQLTLHIVIHSGEKKHICPECGKGFYRKDHLRKHTRSHIARRVKSEVSAQAVGTTGTGSRSQIHAS